MPVSVDSQKRMLSTSLDQPFVAIGVRKAITSTTSIETIVYYKSFIHLFTITFTPKENRNSSHSQIYSIKRAGLSTVKVSTLI